MNAFKQILSIHIKVFLKRYIKHLFLANMEAQAFKRGCPYEL